MSGIRCLNYPEAPTGASKVLDKILNSCTVVASQQEEAQSEEPPTKKGCRPNAASLAEGGTTSIEENFAIVEAADNCLPSS